MCRLLSLFFGCCRCCLKKIRFWVFGPHSTCTYLHQGAGLHISSKHSPFFQLMAQQFVSIILFLQPTQRVDAFVLWCYTSTAWRVVQFLRSGSVKCWKKGEGTLLLEWQLRRYWDSARAVSGQCALAAARRNGDEMVRSTAKVSYWNIDGAQLLDHFGSTDVSGLHFVPRDSHSRNWSLSVFGVFCLLGADLNESLFLKYLCVMTKLFFAFTQALFQPRIISSQGFFPASLLFQPGV